MIAALRLLGLAGLVGLGVFALVVGVLALADRILVEVDPKVRRFGRFRYDRAARIAVWPAAAAALVVLAFGGGAS